MNLKQKGNRNRLKAIKYFESYGYDVAVVERTGRHIKVKDMYGLFDLVAIRKDLCLFIQVASNRPHVHKAFEEYSLRYVFRSIKFIQIVWIDRKEEPKLFEYIKGRRRRIYL